uniref:Uncharacterized protein n=1 Tax=Peronospora matthiolae TaxID=2874970 RepID=A0AAV1U9G9_9STRA
MGLAQCVASSMLWPFSREAVVLRSANQVALDKRELGQICEPSVCSLPTATGH